MDAGSGRASTISRYTFKFRLGMLASDRIHQQSVILVSGFSEVFGSFPVSRNLRPKKNYKLATFGKLVT